MRPIARMLLAPALLSSHTPPGESVTEAYRPRARRAGPIMVPA